MKYIDFDNPHPMQGMKTPEEHKKDWEFTVHILERLAAGEEFPTMEYGFGIIICDIYRMMELRDAFGNDNPNGLS